MRHNFAPSKLEQDVMDTVTGLSQSGGLGELNTPPPNFLPETLTLSQPGGQIMPTSVLRAPRIFRPCDGPTVYNVRHKFEKNLKYEFKFISCRIGEDQFFSLYKIR